MLRYLPEGKAANKTMHAASAVIIGAESEDKTLDEDLFLEGTRYGDKLMAR
jgi:hypothetical protein